MKPASRQILKKIKNNSDGFVIFTTTNNPDITNKNIDKTLKLFNLDTKDNIKENIEELESFLAEYLRESLFNNKFPDVIAWNEALGYYDNKLNPNSFVMLVDGRVNIKKFVKELEEKIIQNEIFVFPASVKYQVFEDPVDNCTLLEDKWIKYDIRDRYVLDDQLHFIEGKQIKKFIAHLLENTELEDTPMSREEILMLGYELSFDHFHPTSFKDSSLEVEDFAQEAFMVLADLYDSGNKEILSINKNNAVPMLNYIIKRYVINKLRRKFRRDYQHISLDTVYSDVSPEHDDTAKQGKSISDIIDNPAYSASGHILTPDEQYDYDDVYSELNKDNLMGIYNDLIMEITNNFTIVPYRSRRYNYYFKGNKEFKMSPKSIAALLLKGYSLNEILEMFMPETDKMGEPIRYVGGKKYASHSSPGSFIRDKFHLIKRQLNLIIDGLNIEDRLFLYEILQELFNKRDSIDLKDEFLIEIFKDFN